MEYKKSYRGFILWLLGYTVAVFLPLPLKAEAAIALRLVFNMTSAGMVLLMWIIWRTESVYWINGTTFEQARDVGSERRKAFAAAHLKVFARFAAAYALFSLIMQWRHISYVYDIVVFNLGIFAAALSTLRIRL